MNSQRTRIKANDVMKELGLCASPKKAVLSARYFKTGEGQYGAGDVFIGVTVPEQRRISESFARMCIAGCFSFDQVTKEVSKLLNHKVHEYKSTALAILTALLDLKINDKRLPKKELKKFSEDLYNFYLKHVSRINNWDLVDGSAREIVGRYLYEYKRKNMLPILKRMAISPNMWERRIAVISTQYSIKNDSYVETLMIVDVLLKDSHDLIHKATGWMLREVGKKDESILKKYLDTHASNMPRTTLRYAIERLSKEDKVKYLAIRPVLRKTIKNRRF